MNYLVSGASRGLALGVVRALIAAGHGVHVIGRDRERLQTARDLVGKGFAHVADLNHAGEARRVVEQVQEVSGTLHGLVLGVGPYHAGTLAQTHGSNWQELWQGNLMCSVALFDAARECLRGSKGSALFFGASGLEGLRARSTTAAYTAVKTALLSYMVSLAKEEAEFGVRVNMVSPGVVPHGGASDDTNDSATWQQVPMGRPGQVGDVAAAALWLLGPDAAYVTGQNLEVAGGFML